MRKPLYLLFLLFLFARCAKEDWSIPTTTCSLDFTDSSQNNPKGSDYQKLIDKVVSRGVPGVVLLVRTPKEGLWIGTAGMSKIETGEPMLPCTIHHSAS